MYLFFWAGLKNGSYNDTGIALVAARSLAEARALLRRAREWPNCIFPYIPCFFGHIPEGIIR